MRSISASCARLFANQGMKVAVAARRADKSVLVDLEKELGVRRYACDAADATSVSALFDSLCEDVGAPRLVVHNIDGRMQNIFRKDLTEADPALVLQTVTNSAYSAFLVAQLAAKSMLAAPEDASGHRGTILFTNASAALKGYPKSAAFAMD